LIKPYKVLKIKIKYLIKKNLNIAGKNKGIDKNISIFAAGK